MRQKGVRKSRSTIHQTWGSFFSQLLVYFTTPAAFQVRGIRVAVGGDTGVPAAAGRHVEAARDRGVAPLDGRRRGSAGGGARGEDWDAVQYTF